MKMARGRSQPSQKRRAPKTSPPPADTIDRGDQTNGHITDYFRAVDETHNGHSDAPADKHPKDPEEAAPDDDREAAASAANLRLSPRKHASTLERCVSAKENVKTPHRISLGEDLEFTLPAARQLTFNPKENGTKRKTKAATAKVEEKPQSAKIKQETDGEPDIQKKTSRINGTVTNGNHKLTDYFPIRRSVRKTKKEVMEQKRLDIEIAIKKQIEDGLKIASIDGKGRGIIAARKFERGEFVVEYAGELVDIAEAKQREVRYAQDLATGCYMYYFRHSDQHYCIDATSESGRLGRLVNHSRNGNLITKSISIGTKPHLILIANQDISPGEEITYDYGDRSKESLQHHPWLAL